MRRNKTATLVLCGVIAASVLLLSRALAEEPTPIDSEDVAIEASEAELTTAALNPSLGCSTTTEPDDLVSFRPILDGLIVPTSDEIIIGVASYYDEPQATASGEQFDPDGFTAAAQLEIRDKFGGIRFGGNYQPAYAVVEYESKKIILKFNDVGPLRPGRKFDLSRAAMAYFGGLEKGLLPDVKVKPLPLGQLYTAGPVTDAQLAALGSRESESAARPVAVTHEPSAIAPETMGASLASPLDNTAVLPTGEIEVASMFESKS
jgi:rare lipoprotein A